MTNYGFDSSPLEDNDVVLLALPDDDPVLSRFDPNDTGDYMDADHDFVFATRWDTDRDRPAMVWGHKPQHRPGANAPYTRVYCTIRKCRLCGIETTGMTATDCHEWRGECNHCGAEIPADAENFGVCDDCRPPLPEGNTSLTALVMYRDRRESYLEATGEV